MKNYLLILLLVVCQSSLCAQQNCELLKADTECYNACLKMNQESMHYQGSYASQKHLSDAIEMCPTLSNAYFEKSVAFLKRGMFIEWKELMDKAVELNPEKHLADRAWGQFTFLHNYTEAIKDLHKLQDLKGSSFIGVGQSGDYDLRIVLALSYKLTDDRIKAIEIIDHTIAEEDYYIGLYDFLHLGVLYLENKEFGKAIAAFEKQMKEKELAETYFYKAKAMLGLKDLVMAKQNLVKAEELYHNGQKMYSRYNEYVDQIYEQDILDLQTIAE